jgi:hypothetical protein
MHVCRRSGLSKYFLCAVRVDVFTSTMFNILSILKLDTIVQKVISVRLFSSAKCAFVTNLHKY